MEVGDLEPARLVRDADNLGGLEGGAEIPEVELELLVVVLVNRDWAMAGVSSMMVSTVD